MKVKTKYRDQSWDETRKCFEGELADETHRAFWDGIRAKDVEIETPGWEGPSENFTCCGPFYKIVNLPAMVCPHFAEIGD